MKLVALCVGVVLGASACCCPCSYLNGLPDVAANVRPELAPKLAPQARAPDLDPR